MRKIFKYCLAVVSVLSVVFATVGCAKDKEEAKETLTVNPATLTFQSDGGRKTVLVEGKDWKATTADEWITVQLSTSNPKIFFVSAAENKSDAVRQGKVSVVSTSGLTTEVTVAQTGLTPTLTIDKNSFEVDKDGATEYVTVLANVEWTATSAQDWCTVTVNGDKVEMVVAPNTVFEARTCVVTVSPVGLTSDALKKEITLNQAAQTYQFAIEGRQLVGKNVDLEFDSLKIDLKVKSNAAWKASCSEDWVTVNTQEMVADTTGVAFPVTLTVNETAAARLANLIFEYGPNKDTVKITQRSSNIYVESDQAEYTVSENELDFAIAIRSNGTLTVKSSESWCNATVAEDGKTIKISVFENQGEKRHATITVTGHKGAVQETLDIKVSQMARATDLSENGTANCYVVPATGTYKFKATVRGNGAITEGFEGQNMTIKPTYAKTLWSTDTTMIANVNMFGDYIYFEASEAEGNALVAAMGPGEDGDEVKWSWHLWCTPYQYNEEVNQYVIQGEAYGVLGTVFMGRNLGAFANGEETDEMFLNSVGLEYQWGRKDPFPGPSTVTFDPTNEVTSGDNNNGWAAAQKNAIIYYEGFRDAETGLMPNSSTSIYSKEVPDENFLGNVQFAVAHPETYMAAKRGSGYLWCTNAGIDNTGGNLDPLDPTTGWAYLWGNPTLSTANVVGQKSIFDPCPVGWQVPSSCQWAFISGHGTDMGRNYGCKAPWKYNSKEFWDSFDAGYNVLDVDKLREIVGKNDDGTYKSYNATALTQSIKHNYAGTMKRGFHVYTESHGTGEIPEDQLLIETTLTRPEGPTMYLPAAGERSWLGYLIRVGSHAFYHSTTIKSSTLTVNDRTYPGGVHISWEGQQYWRYRADFQQQAAALPVRCVKSEIKTLE